MLETAHNEARDRKVSGQELLKNAKFRAMLEKERTRPTKKLPQGMRERLMKGEG